MLVFQGTKIQVKHLDRSVLKKDRLSICSAVVDEQSPLHWTYLSKLGTIFSQTLGRNSKNPLARKMCAISDSILGYLNGCVCLPEVRILNGISISNWGLNNKSGTETQKMGNSSRSDIYIYNPQANQPTTACHWWPHIIIHPDSWCSNNC